MLGWSINLFKVFGIQLAVHASFVLLLVYAGFEGWQDLARVGYLALYGIVIWRIAIHAMTRKLID